MTTSCYVCMRVPAPSEWSEEHVIPNALGGRWKSRTLLCRPCNSTLGSTIDAALCRELGPVMHILNISRERGEVPNCVVQLPQGEFIRNVDGNMRPVRPTIQETIHGDRVEVSIQGGSRKQVVQAVRGIARKYPGKFDPDEWANKMTESVERSTHPTTFTMNDLGSDEALRGIAKIAASAFVLLGGRRDSLASCMPYITGKSSRQLVRWYFEADVMPGRQPGWITHAVAVRADPSSGQLWCYVELFRAFRFVSLLNEAYTGEPLAKDYVHELCTGQPLDVPLTFDPRGIDPDIGGIDIDAFKREAEELMTVSASRSREAAIGGAVERAFSATLQNNPNATGRELMPHLFRELEPLLLDLVRPKRFPDEAEQDDALPNPDRANE